MNVNYHVNSYFHDGIFPKVSHKYSLLLRLVPADTFVLKNRGDAVTVLSSFKHRFFSHLRRSGLSSHYFSSDEMFSVASGVIKLLHYVRQNVISIDRRCDTIHKITKSSCGLLLKKVHLTGSVILHPWPDWFKSSSGFLALFLALSYLTKRDAWSIMLN